jgi:hypothetical protein
MKSNPFCQNEFKTFTAEKVAQNFGLILHFSKNLCTQVNNRLIGSPGYHLRLLGLGPML